MSETKQISPLLDGFTLGNPISDHDGVRCQPAIKEDSDSKYIVKVISIPPSQVQMDALLLSGAYKDAAGAMDYYKTVAEDAVREAELLTKLSKLEGFLGYEGWQIEPITRRRLGYEVYLVGEYRHSLDKFVRRNPIHQLEAINLGLDMCAALSVCRQAGALYVDLKPTNIFVSDKKEYRIGDLGFVPLDALSYTTLPSKYRSAYTPPELEDPMASVGMTTDTYALGMILYQIYNDGQLPPADCEEVPSPVHADYELAEIILKAIAKDPEARWQDPKEMGQALVAYMQRNAVNDVPITPYIPLEETAAPEEVKDEAEEKTEEAPKPEEINEVAQETPPDKPQSEDEVPEAEPQEDESAPGEEDADSLMPHEMSDELTKMMAKADDLIAHKPPEGVVVPEIPEPEDPFAFAKEDEVDDTDIPIDPVMEEPEEKKKKPAKSFVNPEGKLRRKKILTNAAALALVAGIGFAGFWGYRNLYIQTIDAITVTGDRSKLVVQIDSDIPEGKLTVLCSDQYGNAQTGEVRDGRASFTGLQPNTMYTLTPQIEGFHKLGGQTSQVFTTDTTTSILSFTSVAGSADGSLMLSFTVDGQEPEEWTVSYAFDGGETQYKTFTGHSFTVDGLKLGRIYTFKLDAGPDLSLGGNATLDVMASRLILAENITAASATGSDLTIRWRAPGDIVVDSWNVLCYNEEGYQEELTVQEPSAYFPNIDFSLGYTVEITASGMTQAARTSITPNPIHVTGLQVEEGDAMNVTWNYTGEDPSGGWLLLYSIDGGEIPEVVKTNEAFASISPLIPGATYRFTIQAADGTTVLSNVQEYKTADPAPFTANKIKVGNFTANLLRTPSETNWRFEDVNESEVSTKFMAGDQLSMALTSSEGFYLPAYEVEVMTLIRDEQGRVIPGMTRRHKVGWKNIWQSGDAKTGEFDLGEVPALPGKYTASVLIDGKLIGQAPFEIVQ